MRSNLRALALAIALACATVALPAHADWKRDYDRGARAVEKQNWAEAESAFRSAIAEEPTPDARKRFQGVRTAVYVPHYYAGLAAWRQGACDRALAYWSNAASSAVVAGIGKLDAEQERGQLDCRRRVAANAPTPSTPAATTPAGTAANTSAGTTKPTTPTPAGTVKNAPPAASTTKPATPPASTPAKPATPPATPATAPAALATAVQQFLAGSYDALIKLDPATLADGRARAQAFLLRAAARHTDAQLRSGDAQLDATQLDAIRRDIRAARAANANLEPDAVLFSPRFRTLWQQTR